MEIVISDGSTKNFEVGDLLKIKPGALPEWYDDQWLEIIRFETYAGVHYPFVRFFHQEADPETGSLVTVQDETSALSGDLILP